MRRWMAGLVLASALAALVGVAAAAAGADVVAGEPREGDRATYEGYERVATEAGGLVENRSLDHQRAWNRSTFPLPSGGEVALPTLEHRYPVPEAQASSSPTSSESFVDAIRALDAAEEEPTPVRRDVVEVDVRHERVPGPPGAFSMAQLDTHAEDEFWRVFRLHARAEGWCASDPVGAFAGLATEDVRDAAQACLSEVPWGETIEANVSVSSGSDERWGTTWQVDADVVYATDATQPGRAGIELRFSPRVSMELERTVTRVEPGEDGNRRHVRHLELVGFAPGEQPLGSAQLPAEPRVDETVWTREGPQIGWDPAVGFGEAREAVDRDPRTQAYRRDNPEANLTYAQYTRVGADERSSSTAAGLTPGNCEAAEGSPVDEDAVPGEAGWSLYLSGEAEDAIAWAERRRGSETREPVEAPPRTETSRFDSPGASPGMGLPRRGPAPVAMFDHVSAADALGARGDPFVAAMPPGESGSTSVAEDEPLLGAAGRVQCTLTPTGTYAYENVGVAFAGGQAAGVYSLRVEAVEDEGVGLAQLGAPPAGEDPEGGPSAGALAGLAVAATGLAGWAGPRLLGSLYSRIRDREVLDHEVRQAIDETIATRPGLCLPELAEEFDRHRSTIAYHLDRLEEAGLVETRSTASGRIVFPAGHPLVDVAETLALGRARELVALVREDPGRSLSAYAGDLDVTKGYVSRLADELREADLLESRREGRRRLLATTARADPLFEGASSP